MRGRRRRERVVASRAVAAVAVVLLAGCAASSTSESTSAGGPSSTASLTLWLADEHVVSLADVAAPSPSWTRATSDELMHLLVGSVSEPAAVKGVPIAFMRDRSGAMVFAVSGWTSSAAPSDEAALCREAQSWLATAEDTHGLVSGFGEIADACLAVPEAATRTLSLPTRLALECAPSASGQVSTCAAVDADRDASRHLVLVTTVAVQS